MMPLKVRKPIDFAIVSVAVVLPKNETICSDARIVSGAVGPALYRATAAEETIIGHPVSREAEEAVAEAGLIEGKGMNKNGYKIQMAKALIRRAILGQNE
jgi:xanthine dehydrogenase YagS FAD-binding subunit